MQISTLYCSHCLQKFYPEMASAKDGMLNFFVPTFDELNRQCYAYISMHISDVDAISAMEQHNIDISLYSQILHVELGDWPSPERQAEIHDFYQPINVYSDLTHNKKVA